MAETVVPNERVALVTGSVRGLGLAVARHLRSRGDRVHIVYRDSVDLARELAGEWAGRIHRADLCVALDAERLIADVSRIDGRIDCVVHAVGEYCTGPLEHTEAADLRRMFASNVESSFLLMNAARAELRRTHGCVVFFGVAGLEGLRGRRRTAAYAAAKTALVVLVRSWALEEARFGVRVNMVSPGSIPHPHAAPDTLELERHKALPMGRAGTPEEIAAAVGFLTGNSARYITGIDLPVAGGYLV